MKWADQLGLKVAVYIFWSSSARIILFWDNSVFLINAHLQLNLKVLVDLHGAPGSQNGHDHSGHTGPIDWLNNGNVARTISIIGKLAGVCFK
jgi:hypothetical protein